MSSPNAFSDEALLQRALIRLDDPAARRRLTRAWLAPVARRRKTAADIFFEIAESRWRTAETAGSPSPLEAARGEDDSLAPTEDVRRFVAQYARNAASRQRALAEAVGTPDHGANGPPDSPALHLRKLNQDRPIQLPVERVIDLAKTLLEQSLDCAVDATRSQDGVILALSDRTGRTFGHVQLDLSTGGRTKCTESPASLAGSTVGRALLRCVPSSRGYVLTYESFFLFVHEIGHAMTHAAGATRSVFRGPWSGLTYGPVLHAESVSTLTEKIAFHPDLASWFGITSHHEAAALSAHQKLAYLEFLKNEVRQVTVAWVDCVTMGGAQPERNLSLVLSGLPPGSWSSEWEIIPYFVTQLLARYPGAAGTAYLASNAYSFSLFEELWGRSFDACLRSVGAGVNGAVTDCRYPALRELDSTSISRVSRYVLTDER